MMSGLFLLFKAKPKQHLKNEFPGHLPGKFNLGNVIPYLLIKSYLLK
jgi:hypothetical protein